MRAHRVKNQPLRHSQRRGAAGRQWVSAFQFRGGVEAHPGAALAVITEAALSYLGYGVQGSQTSLGALVAIGAQAAETRPWLFYFPGIAILIIVLSINLIGDGVRDAFDPSANRNR